MAVDRTGELLAYLNATPVTSSSSSLKKGGESSNADGRASSILRNRHREERFALEDQKSPSLSEAVFSDSDMERGTPPATFIGMASSVLKDINDARRLIGASIKAGQVGNPEIQAILDLCLQRIKVLQDVADTQCEARLAERGWFASFGSGGHSQVDQHEATVVWFLNRMLSSLSRAHETAKGEEEMRLAREAKLRLAHQSALASFRPTDGLGPRTAEMRSGMPPMSKDSFKDEFGLGDKQLQELVLENDNLLREYTDMQRDLSTARTSINEIARLQTTLQEQIMYQATQIDRLFDEAASTTETVRKANAHLGQAAGHQSASVRLFLYFVLLATLFLLLLHVISD